MLVNFQKKLLKHIMIFTSGLCCGALFVGFMISSISHADTGLSRDILKWFKEDYKQINELKHKSEYTFQILAKKLGAAHAQMLILEHRMHQLAEGLGLSFEEFKKQNDQLQHEALIQQPDASLFENMTSLEHRLLQRAREIGALEDVSQLKKINDLTKPNGEFHSITKGWVSSSFGYRQDPFNGKKKWHSGIDIASHSGTPVNAIASGVVSFSGTRGGYGNLLEINHGNGLVTRYAHNAKLLVKEGDLVHKGTPIALVGETGRATAPHVHFEVREHGKAVNPSKYIQIVSSEKA